MPADPFIVAGTQNGYVIALRTDTGAVVWRWGGDQIVEDLVSSGDVVYVTSYSASLSASNAPAVLTALRMSDGSKLWQRTEPQLQGYSTYMAVDGGALVVAARDGNDTVYGFDAHSGRLQWTYPGNGFRQGLLITATGGIAYIDGINRGFIALDDQTGKRLWTYDKGNEPAITTGPNGPTIVAGSGGLVYYYEEEAWPIPLSTPSIVTFEAATDTVRETLTWDQTGDPLLVTPDGTAYTDPEQPALRATHRWRRPALVYVSHRRRRGPQPQPPSGRRRQRLVLLADSEQRGDSGQRQPSSGWRTRQHYRHAALGLAESRLRLDVACRGQG